MLSMLLAVAITAAAAQAPPPARHTIGDLQFMAGSWSNESKGLATEEHWMLPKAGAMLGMSRTTKGDRMVEFEFLRLEERADGVFYLASPGGQNPPTPFRLKELTNGKAVFENPEHDFPQRILYWKNGASLCARVEGTVGGQSKGQEWCWTAMK